VPRPRVTERSFYSAISDVLRKKGGKSVEEIHFISVPDIVFDLGGRKWLLSVKIGEDPKTIKDAFIQYLRHKDDSKYRFGMVLFLPERIRSIKVSEDHIIQAIHHYPVTALIDADDVKEELRNCTFPNVVDFLVDDVLVKLDQRVTAHYPINRVISLLKVHVSDLMAEMELSERTVLKIITHRQLLSNLGHLTAHNAEQVARFLASFILLSQILFLRLLSSARPEWIGKVKPTKSGLHTAFQKILEINYRPIYEFDVLGSVSEEYARDTYSLIWGLQVEKIRYELPGRIFHELMPHDIRKMLAAFYTRPQAAELLAQLTVSKSMQTVFDLACGSGTILTAAYKRKAELTQLEGIRGNMHKRFCEEQIFGADIMPFAVHLTTANLAAMDPGETIEKTQIALGDSLKLQTGGIAPGLNMDLFPMAAKGQTSRGEDHSIELAPVDVVLGNPPFTKLERGIRKYVHLKRFLPLCGGEVGLWGHFIALSDSFLKESGVFGAVIPINVLRGRESAKIRNLMFSQWTPKYILKCTLNYGFSEWSEYRDIIFIAEKRAPKPDEYVKFCLVKKKLGSLQHADIAKIADKIHRKTDLRGDQYVDIDSHRICDLKARAQNLMWYCGVTDLSHRDIILGLYDAYKSKLMPIDPKLTACATGLRTEGGDASYVFITRKSSPTRIEKAFLRFERELKTIIHAESELNVNYELDRSCFVPSLRTPVGIHTMSLRGKHDYLAQCAYEQLPRVCRAAGAKVPHDKSWKRIRDSIDSAKAHLLVCESVRNFV